MSLALKPYAKYKDSGVPWIESIPDHWDVCPAFAVYRPILEKNTGIKEDTVLSLSYGRIVVKPREKLHGLVPESFETYQVVNPGDIVIRTTDLQNDHTSLRVGLVRDRGIITSAYLALRTERVVDPDFGYQYLNVWDLTKAIYGYGSGLRQNLDFAHFKRMPVALPSLPEQAAIVRFLAHVDRCIRRYIRTKQQLIKLLEEQKQAIIHQAVTGQIDVRTGKPYPAYKESGVEWLGQVPKHWDVRRLGVIGRLFKGNGGTKEDDAASGVPCIRYGDIYMHHRYFVRSTRSCVSVERASDYTPIRYGDVLFAGSGETIEEIGKSVVCLLDTPACCGGDVIVFRPCIETDAVFMGYAADSWQAVFQKSCLGRGITVMHVYGDQLKNLWLALPPIPEQRAIVRHLDDALHDADIAIEHAKHEIELLREYRTCLIADVVTGKLDVREAAANLPDEAEEPELLEDETLISDEDRAEETAVEETALEEVEA